MHCLGSRSRCESRSADYVLITAPTSPVAKVRRSSHRRLHVGSLLMHVLVGLAMSFLQGSKEEWSLVRRHPSEATFGMQIAGSKPALLVPAAEIIGRECAENLDFVDLNCGCPIDLVYKTGSGSARRCLQLGVDVQGLMRG